MFAQMSNVIVKMMLFFCLLIFVNANLNAQQQKDFSFWVLEDSLNQYTWQDIRQQDPVFTLLKHTDILFNITESTVWIKFRNCKPYPIPLYFELSAPTIHFIDFYQPVDKQSYNHYSTGFLKNFETRPIQFQHFVFPLKPDSSWHYLRLKSGHFLNTEFRIADLPTLASDETRRNIVFGWYSGVLIFIVLLVMVLVFQTKQYHFLYYIGFVLSGSAITLVESGIAFYYLWPKTPLLNFVFPLYTFGVSFFILYFLKYAFKANSFSPLLFRINLWMLTIFPFIVTIILLCLNNYFVAIIVVQLCSIVIAFLVLAMTLVCFSKSKEFKIYYRLMAVGQLLMVLSVALYLASQNKVIQLSFFRDFVIMSGGVAEAMCFTLAIFTYQSSLVKKYYRLLKEQNNMLQEAVDLRTTELEFNNKALIAAMQEKDSLLNIVIHDLKSPLNQTKALGKLLMHHIADAETRNNMLKRIEQASDHGIRLIDELTTISKLERINEKLYFDEVKLIHVCMPLLQNMELIAMQKHIDLKIEIDQLATITTYPPYLIRIIENLLSNAIKFSPPDSEIIFLADRSKISITDNGPGFSDQDLKIAFRKFQRLSAQPTAGESSTGLGLYIVKLLADKLKINIEIHNQIGLGTRIELIFLVKANT